jgi:hypothetical protein
VACLLQDHTAADTLLFFVKRLWGQPYVAPIYALLLHRWMLLRKEAGGVVQRQKHVGVLVFGGWRLLARAALWSGSGTAAHVLPMCCMCRPCATHVLSMCYACSAQMLPMCCPGT